MGIINYKHFLICEEKSVNTIKKYIRDVNRFLDFVGNRELSKEVTIEYKNHLISKEYEFSSINSMLASINTYFRFVERRDCIVKSICVQRKPYCNEEKELTRQDYVRLIDTTRKQGNKRLELIIQTICSTGIRVGELKYITVEAVKMGEARVALKGKVRYVFFVRKLRQKLLEYIKCMKIKSGPIFLTSTGKLLDRTNVWREMKKLSIYAGVRPEKIFPHNLRHLFARIFYSMEKDIVKLADLLGHSSINTTRVYIISTGYEHRKRMENMKLIT